MAQEKRVIMAEKRNAGEDIAKAIGLKNISRKGSSGFIHGTDEDGDEIVIVWSNGHCIELPEPEDFDEKYKKWSLSDLPLPLNNDAALNVKRDKRSLFKDIQNELKDADSIINAGDAGREGELIQRWILRKAGKGKKDIYRLWVQSTTAKAIKEAYENGLLGSRSDEIKKLNNLYDSGRARAIMDKYIGYNYSRLLSLTQTDGMTVNYGRCKSPLVHAIVERDIEIENFVSVPFSYLELVLEKGGVAFKASLVDDKKSRIEFSPEDRAEAEKICAILPAALCVKEVDKKDKLVTPPQPYDTLQLQKEMANKYGFEASKTLEIMEKLYDTYHILSYPRTEARYYTTDLKEDLRAVLGKLTFGEFEPFARRALNGFIPDKYFNNAKIADHHALAPVCDGSIEEIYRGLSEDERRVYDAVIKNFIALHLPNYEYESIDALADCSGHLFRIKGKRDISLGYKVLYLNDKKKEKEDESEDKSDQAMPEISRGDTLPILSKEVKDSCTKPKKRFTTASLLDFMKINNIGTGATRDRIISELTEKKGYNSEGAVRKDGKYFVSTELGRALDSVIPEKIKSIDRLRVLETRLQDIAEGNMEFKEFISQMEAEFSELLSELRNTQSKISVPKPDAKILQGVRCPVCGRDISILNWGYSCTGWSKDGSGCNFAVGKKQYGKTLPEKVIRQLIDTGKTGKLSGLKGMSGKAFDAPLSLVINDNGKAVIRPVFEKER